MNALIVHAHPHADSFSRALRDRAEAGLNRQHDTRIIDLYADGFDPVMTTEERRRYETDDPICSPLVQTYADDIRWAQALVFVYPTWWSGLPAMLKGFFDRVMVRGVAFDFDEKGKITPRLQRIRVIAGITTHGSARWETRLLTDPGRRTIMRTLRLNTGLLTKRVWLDLPDLDRATLDDRTEFLERVETRMAKL